GNMPLRGSEEMVELSGIGEQQQSSRIGIEAAHGFQAPAEENIREKGEYALVMGRCMAAFDAGRFMEGQVQSGRIGDIEGAYLEAQAFGGGALFRILRDPPFAAAGLPS